MIAMMPRRSKTQPSTHEQYERWQTDTSTSFNFNADRPELPTKGRRGRTLARQGRVGLSFVIGLGSLISGEVIYVGDGSLTFREFIMREPLPLATIHDAVLEFLRGRTDAVLFGRMR